MNKVFLLGRLVRNPELRKTESGNKLTRFTIAVRRRGSSEDADFIDCIAWNKTAELIFEHFPKGRPILIIGRLRSRIFEDQHGQRRFVIEVVVDDFEFVDRKNSNGNATVQTSDDTNVLFDTDPSENPNTTDEINDSELEKWFESENETDEDVARWLEEGILDNDSPEDDLPF